jgi:hypothetical protein
MKKAVLATSAAAILCTAVIAQLSGMSGQSQSAKCATKRPIPTSDADAI